MCNSQVFCLNKYSFRAVNYCEADLEFLAKIVMIAMTQYQLHDINKAIM